MPRTVNKAFPALEQLLDATTLAVMEGRRGQADADRIESWFYEVEETLADDRTDPRLVGVAIRDLLSHLTLGMTTDPHHRAVRDVVGGAVVELVFRVYADGDGLLVEIESFTVE